MSIAVVALAIAFVFFQYLPLNRKAKSLKAANASLLAENAAAGARVEALPQLYKEIEKIKEQVGDFDAKIPVGRSHGLFLQDLTSVMQKQGLERTCGPARHRDGNFRSVRDTCVYPLQGKTYTDFQIFQGIGEI